MTDTTAPDTPHEHHRHAPEKPPRNPWKVIVIVIAALVGVALIAWGVWAFAGSGSTPAPTPTPTPTPTVTPTPTPTPTEVPTPPNPPTEGACTTDTATAELGTPDAAAGSVQVPIIFTNTSNEACTLEGFPTVEFVGDGNGTQIGSSATHDTSTAVALVTIQPGDSAMALLTITTADVDSCSPTPADGFRVIPPGSNDAFFLATTDYQACDNTSVSILAVSAVATN